MNTQLTQALRPDPGTQAALDGLLTTFLKAVSFERGDKPAYSLIAALFVPEGLLANATTGRPEVVNVANFIAPRQQQVDAGTLTRFHEAELWHEDHVFGRVAHRLSGYTKSGVRNGLTFGARGVITTQFVCVDSGWLMLSMTWDDERDGLSLPPQAGDQ